MRLIYYIDVRRALCALLHPEKCGEGGGLTLHTNVCGNIAYVMVSDGIKGGLDAKKELNVCFLDITKVCKLICLEIKKITK